MENQKLTGYPSIDKPWQKYYSEETIHAPIPEGTLYHYILENNKDYLGNIALDYCDQKISYHELFDNIDKAADTLNSKGVQPGDIITLCLPNTPEAVYLFYASNKLGAICHLLDPRANILVMREHLKLAPSKWLFTFPEIYPIFRAIEETTAIEQIVLTNVEETINPFKDAFPNTKTYSDFLAYGTEKEKFPILPDTSNLPACILHTGGTTGTPKGVLLTNRNFHAQTVQWKYLNIPFSRGVSLLSLMPSFVSFGLIANLHIPLSCGMRLILIPNYNPEEIVELIKKYTPNCIPASPAHWECIYHSQEVQTLDLSFLKYAAIAGDTLNSKIERKLNSLFRKTGANITISKWYGLTKAATAVSMPALETVNLPDSVGIPLPQTTVGIFDDALQELAYNKPGEIAIRSDSVMRGFYNNDDETQKVLIKHTDGYTWLHSGDIGEMNEDGVLSIKGRIKRMIIRFDGIKVYLPDVEIKILNHAAVSNCAVIGIKDEEHIQGAVPVAFIVLRQAQSSQNMLAEIQQYCKENIFDYALPKKFFFIERLPYTKNGKIDYRALEEMAAAPNKTK